ncbi:MAG: ferrous iron transport protein A [Deltaproteobacteria bacterium]|nr:ferrous iron transport protein A [Deltaproteobacteria bacterium]
MQFTLDQLRPGARAVVVTVSGDGALTQRLTEMGLVGGAEVAMIRTAPLGDPLEIWLDGYHLSLRQREARLVTIAPQPAGDEG